MKRLLAVIGSVVIVFVFFYIFFIIPNDSRVSVRQPDVHPAGPGLEAWYDFTEQLPSAAVAMPYRQDMFKRLGRYPYKETHPFLHASPLNIHVSLGWFPMKTVHRDCILAPASLAYPALVIPDHAVLTFDYGIVSSINRQVLGPVTFKVVLKGPHGHDQVVFEKTVEPIQPYRWKYYDSFYKNVYKYLRPGLADRDGRWESVSVALDEYSRGPVSVEFTATPAGDYPTLAFWGQPRLLVPAEGRRKKNVLLVVIDSMRADHFSRALSPELARWARDGIVFEHAFSNGNMTKLSVSSFLTSRYPFEMPEVARQYDLSPEDKNAFYARRFPTLAGTLRNMGYRTAQIGSVSLFSDGHGFSADMGFDESVNLEHSGYSPPHVTDAAIEWIERHGQEPFFLMAYYEGPHGPYRPPLKYLLRALQMGDLSFGSWRDVLYRGEILYHDAYLARLRQYLVSRGLDKDTVVIVTSDHGVAFRSNTYDWPTKFGAWKKKRVRFHSHGVSVTPEDIHVPLVIIGPQIAAGVRGAYVQLLDLAPTIVSLCGGTPPRDFHGNNLAPLLAGKAFDEPVTFHQGWLNYGVYAEHRYLYIRNTAPRDGFPPATVVPEELYDIARDSRCADNLAETNPVRLIAMRRLARSFVRPARQIRIGVTGPAGTRARLSLTVNDPAPRTVTAVVLPNETKTFDVGELRSAVVSGTVNGRPVTPADILVGRGALPLAARLVFSADDLDLAAGWPQGFARLPGRRVLIGVLEKDTAAEKTLKNAPQQLKSMLEQWGYIH